MPPLLSAAPQLGPSVYHPPVRAEPSPPLQRAALEHIDALYRLARRLSTDASEAEDLVQETFARALGAQAQFVPGTNARAWLFRILRNLHIDRCRRTRASPVRPALGDDEPADDVSGRRELLRGDAEIDRLRRVVAEDIEAALQALSVDARTVVLLDVEGFTEGEIAEVLGCQIGTVKSRLSRARAALRERLSEYAR